MEYWVVILAVVSIFAMLVFAMRCAFAANKAEADLALATRTIGLRDSVIRALDAECARLISVSTDAAIHGRKTLKVIAELTGQVKTLETNLANREAYARKVAEMLFETERKLQLERNRVTDLVRYLEESGA